MTTRKSFGPKTRSCKAVLIPSQCSGKALLTALTWACQAVGFSTNLLCAAIGCKFVTYLISSSVTRSAAGQLSWLSLGWKGAGGGRLARLASKSALDARPASLSACLFSSRGIYSHETGGRTYLMSQVRCRTWFRMRSCLILPVPIQKLTMGALSP